MATNTKQDTLSMSELQKKFGITAAYLKTDPSLQKVLKQILSQKITSPERQQAMIQNTSWWKGYTNSLRAYEQVKMTNPGEYKKNLASTKESVMQTFTTAGVDIDDATAERYADMLLRGSSKIDSNGNVTIYDQAWLNDQLAASIDFSKTKEINGVKVFDLKGGLDKTVSDLYALASDYGIDTAMSADGFNNWMKTAVSGLISGDMSEADITKNFREQAISMFPGLATRLQGGETLRQIADPYLQQIQQDLGVADVSLRDNLVQKMFNSSDKDGKPVPMSLYDARKAIRKDTRWQYSEGARNEYQGIAKKIMADFGFGV